MRWGGGGAGGGELRGGVLLLPAGAAGRRAARRGQAARGRHEAGEAAAAAPPRWRRRRQEGRVAVGERQGDDRDRCSSAVGDGRRGVGAGAGDHELPALRRRVLAQRLLLRLQLLRLLRAPVASTPQQSNFFFFFESCVFISMRILDCTKVLLLFFVRLRARCARQLMRFGHQLSYYYMHSKLIVQQRLLGALVD